MSLQSLIEKIKREANFEAEGVFLDSKEILKLIEACEVLWNFADIMKLSHPCSDHDWILADMALTESDEICKDVSLE